MQIPLKTQNLFSRSSTSTAGASGAEAPGARSAEQTGATGDRASTPGGPASPRVLFDEVKHVATTLMAHLREELPTRLASVQLVVKSGLELLGVDEQWLRKEVRALAARGIERLADAVDTRRTGRPAWDAPRRTEEAPARDRSRRTTGSAAPASAQAPRAAEASQALSEAERTRAELRAAAGELFAAYARPARDDAFRAELQAFLESTGEVDLDALDDRAAAMAKEPMRFQFARNAQALQALLSEASLPEPLRVEAVKRLGKVGGTDALPLLEPLQGVDGVMGKAATQAARDIQKAQKLDIVLSAMEVRPFAGSGGLGNYMGELPRVLAKMGHRVTVVMPLHETIDTKSLKSTGKTGIVMGPDATERFALRKKREDGVDWVFIENDRYFSKNRPGLYGDASGPYADEAQRYDFFGAALRESLRILKKTPPDIVQVNDAHIGTAPAYLKEDPFFEKTRVVMTVHNAGGAYQGRYSGETLPNLRFDGLGAYEWANVDSPVEFHSDVNFLKYGISEAHLTNTVSRTHKDELKDPGQGERVHGNLCGVFQKLDTEGRLFGCLNGIDNEHWNPRTDPVLPARYSIDDLTGKTTCKATLQARYGLPVKPRTPLFGVVSRIDDEQKAMSEVIDRVRRAIDSNEDIQFVVCGQGDPELCRQLTELAAARPDVLAFDGAFQPRKEREIIAGSDFFLMPSYREPGGLTPLYASRYVTPSIVRGVGGPDESIQDFDTRTGTGNGIKFQRHEHLNVGIDRALELYRQDGPEMRQLLRNAADSNFDWSETTAPEMVALYRYALDL